MEGIMPKTFKGGFGDEIAPASDSDEASAQNPLIGPEGEPPASVPPAPHVMTVDDEDLLAPPAKPDPSDDMEGAS
jgi:hypothetical protein